MKNAVILLGFWLGILLVAYGIAFVDEGRWPAEVVVITEEVFVDPGNQYSVPVPNGWTAQQTDHGLHLSGPLEAWDVWVIATDDLGMFRAIDDAWRRVEPCGRFEAVSHEELPRPSASERRVKVVYSAADLDTAYAIGHTSLGGTVVLFVCGHGEPLPRIARDLARIEAGLTSLQTWEAPESVPAPSAP